MLVVLIILAAILFYAWVVYPVLVMGLGRPKLAAHSAPPTARTEEFPAVAILFSAHNEEAVIRQRLENLAELDYPVDRLHVYVGVDGGTDRTAEIATAWAAGHANVSLVVSPENHGKMAMLKRLAGLVKTADSGAEYTERMLLFTDANTMFRKDAVTILMAQFRDERVGGVCGRLVFLGGGRSEDGTDEPVYWDFETRLKIAESALVSCLGANGAIYAIRERLFPVEIPDNTIVDDFVIGMKVCEQGTRMVYESGAVATEELPVTVEDEWRRRVRIGTGAYQALTLCWRCLLPRHGMLAWIFWSHKVLRWLTPHLVILLVASGCWVVAEWVRSASASVVNLAGIGLAIVLVLGFMVCWGSRWGRKGFKLVSYFIVMQAALFFGFLRFCRGNLKGGWERTAR
jgi:cellulose synthase/poly-beta-1,6-N-acetylglucosamine synthase-like glycosyltransferase